MLLVEREIPRNPFADGEGEPGRGARGGEDDLPDVLPHGRLEDTERAVHVRLQHLERGRAERARHRRQVDDDVRAGKSPGQRLLVLELGLAEADIVPPRPVTTDGDELVPALVQGLEDVRPDRPARTGNGDLHRPSARDRRGLRPSPRCP